MSSRSCCGDRWEALDHALAALARAPHRGRRSSRTSSGSPTSAAALNHAIAESPLLGADYEIGHTYFFDVVGFIADQPRLRSSATAPGNYLWAADGQPTAALLDLWSHSLEPLLGDYLSGLDGGARDALLRELEAVFLAPAESDARRSRSLTARPWRTTPRCRAWRRRSHDAARRVHRGRVRRPRRARCCSRRRRTGPAGRSGRYAGQLTLDGRSLVIEPRMGWDALGGWVAAATGLHVPAAGGGDARARLAALASMLWVRAVDGASRHGPPAFRRDVRHVGGSVRGHLDVRRTVRLRAKGATTAASVYRARELDNPVTRIIVAADRVLMRQVGQGRWRTDRVDAVMAQLQTAVGRRTRLPATASCTGCATRRSRARSSGRRSCRRGSSGRIRWRRPPCPAAFKDWCSTSTASTARRLLNWARDGRPDLRAEMVDSGQVVLRDRQHVRAMLGLLPAASGGGAPVLAVSAFGAATERLRAALRCRRGRARRAPRGGGI